MPEPTPAQRDALTRIADEFAGLAHQIRVLTQPETPTQDAHTPRTAPQTRSGGTESGEGREGGSLGDRLRTEADDYDRAHNGESVFTATLRYLAHEADALRTERDALWTQVYAVRTAIEREAAHGDAITRCNLVAERFRTVLDGAAPKERVVGVVSAEVVDVEATDALRAEVQRRLGTAYGKGAGA